MTVGKNLHQSEDYTDNNMANNESKYEKVPKKTEDETAFIDTEDINKTE